MSKLSLLSIVPSRAGLCAMSESPDFPTSRLTSRPLPRADISIPPVVWQLTNDVTPQVVSEAVDAGTDWLFIPEDVDPERLRRARSLLVGMSLIVGVDTEQLLSRRSRPLEQRLEALGREQCDGVMLQHAEITELKAGRPFHRLNQLRDKGKTKLAFIEAADAADAEWIIESTPAHGVSVPFDLHDQLVKYRVFASAAEMGTALLSRRSSRAMWTNDLRDGDADICFRVGDGGVTSIVESLPTEVSVLRHVLSLVQQPMVASEREKWWSAFQAAVPAPPKSARGHPPEYGS
jgi:hypothetical protein